MSFLESVSNLYKISAFVNKEVVNPNIDLKKIEKYKILSVDALPQHLHPNKLYEKIMSNLNVKVIEPTTMVSKTTKPISENNIIPTTNTNTNSPMPVDNNKLLGAYDFTPKKPTTNTQNSPYEENVYNKIIYGGSNAEELDDKMNMLESIYTLREELKKLDIEISHIPQVDENSNYQDICRIRKALLHKKNISMHYETARDIFLVGINKLIEYCDGSKTSWGHRPDLKGWDRTAKFKLNTLKTELAELASSFFTRYNISSLGQILFSLVPSAFIYASMRSQQNKLEQDGNDALFSLINN